MISSDEHAGEAGEEGETRQLHDEVQRLRNELRTTSEHYQSQATELRAANQQQSEAHLAAIFSEAQVGLSEIAHDGRFLHVNDTLCRILGRSRDELLTLGIADVTLPEDIPTSLAATQQLMATGQPISLDKRYIRPDGTMIWANSALSLLNLSVDEPPVILAVTVDLTRRRLAEQALRDNEERQAYLLRLSDTLQPLSDGAAIQAEAVRMLGQQLTAGGVLYGQVSDDGAYLVVERNYAAGDAPSPAGRYAMADLGSTPVAALSDGQMIALPEIATAAELTPAERQAYTARGMMALAGVPLMKERVFVACILIYYAAPHMWTVNELALIQETARRAWDNLERARIEAVLREREGELARVQVIGGVAGVTIDITRGLTGQRSPEYRRLHGLAPEVASETHEQWLERVHPDDREQAEAALKRALAGNGSAYRNDYRIIRPDDGQQRWISAIMDIERDADGQPVRLIGAHIDITERKHVEEALRGSEERFRLLVEGARDYAMFLMDTDQRIVFWSAGAERLFGWSEAEAVGQPASFIFTPKDREQGITRWEVQRAYAYGRAEDRRWHVRKDGTRLFVDGIMMRLDDENGSIRGFVKIGRDATAQREAEDALRRAHDELEARVQERTAELAAANDLLQREVVERRQLAAQRAVLVERVLTEQETERQRIARELHDTLGQFLSALHMRLSMALALEGVSSGVTNELAQLLALSGRIDREVDRLTMELRPPALEDFGLADALRSYASEWSAMSHIPVDMLVIGLDDERLRPAIETTVYRIVQEALTNVLKHAHARAVSVVVTRRLNMLRAIIEDNGVGFDARARATFGVGGRQVGLIGMSERVALVGGTLTIETVPGAGTTILLHIPLDKRSGRDTGHAPE